MIKSRHGGFSIGCRGELAKETARESESTRIGAAVLFLTLFILSRAAWGSERPWTLPDSMAVRELVLETGNPIARIPPLAARRPIVVSPDGEYFFFVTTGGDLENDADLSVLFVYRTRTLLRWLEQFSSGLPPPALREVRFRSRHAYASAIREPAWDVDSGAIVFQAASGEGVRRDAYRLDVRSGVLQRLSYTKSIADEIFWVIARGEGSLHLESRKPLRLPAARYPVEWVERSDDGWLPRAVDLQNPQRVLVASYQGRTDRVIPFDLEPDKVWLAPNGSLAIARASKRIGTLHSANSAFARIDLRRGSATELEAAAGPEDALYRDTKIRVPQSGVFWSQDGMRAVFVNVTLNTTTMKNQGKGISLQSGDVDESFKGRKGPEASTDRLSPEQKSGGKERSPRGRDGQVPIAGAGNTGSEEADSKEAIVEYEVASGRWRVLELLKQYSESTPRYVSTVGWLKLGRDLLVTHETGEGKSDGTLYSFTESGITAQSVEASLRAPLTSSPSLVGGLKVRVKQGVNEPPQLLVSNGHREALLVNLNPQLEAVQLLRTKDFRWREPDGREFTGGLTLPPGRIRRPPLPLVIQAYIYQPNLFLPDGGSRAADAVQALASRGMAVLQLDTPVMTNPTPKDEGPLFVQRIDAVVEELTRQGIVDPNRVGATGFSRAGAMVLHAVTHPGRVSLAAAMGADFFSATYPEYLQDASRSVAAVQTYHRIRGNSFWEDKAKWLQDDPTFNVDRAVTPFLMTKHGLDTLTDEYTRNDFPQVRAIIGAFALNDKPLEYLHFAYADHSLIRPLERVASQEAMIDWMAFWLQDYEDPSPHKAMQYQRWRSMREQLLRSAAPRNASGSVSAP